MYDVIIVGGGIVGLSVLREAIKNDLKVLIIDANEVGKNTSYAAAGMLAPINELEHGEENLLFAGQKSVPLYLEYENDLGDIGLSRKGTIEIALSQIDAQYLKREFDYRKKLGLNVEWLDKNQILQKESFLSPHILGGIYSNSEWQVDNRLLLSKLKNFGLKMGAEICEFEPVVDWQYHQNHLSVHSLNHSWKTQNLVFCLGYTPKEFFPLPYSVYPVKGQMLSVKKNPSLLDLEHVIRFKTRSLGNGYIVPKSDRIVLGATNEEMGNDYTITAGGMMDILRKCYAALPAIYDLEILETWVGLRPSTQDRHPFILKAHKKNVFYLNGFYRNGFCLAPIFAKNLIYLLKEKPIDEELKFFVKFL